MVQCQFQTSIKTVQADWGGEYRSLVSFLKNLGIRFQHPCPHVHLQNGRIERKNRHIVDLGFTLLAQAKIPLKYWWEALKVYVYLINRLPSSTIEYMSPFFKLYKTAPRHNYLKVFGCACFPHLRPYNSFKLQFRSTKCIFLGYSAHHKGYKCLHPFGRVYIADSVDFNEGEFSYSSPFPSQFIMSFPMSFISSPFILLDLLFS